MYDKLSLKELHRKEAEDNKKAEKFPLVVILDNVRSMYNIGNIFRTCDAMGAEKIYLTGITATPPHKEIHKTALGAENSVNWEYFKTGEEAVKNLRTEGYTIVGIEQTKQSIMLNEWKTDKTKKFGIIFGHEVYGVSNEMLKYCDLCIEIPQFGSKHSFNVSVCAGIVLWEFLK